MSGMESQNQELHSLQNKQMIGNGFTSDVYALDDDKILKLFNRRFSAEAARYEANICSALNALNLHAPRYYELVEIEDRIGLVYQRIYGISLTDAMAGNIARIPRLARMMAREHNDIHSTRNVRNIPAQNQRLSFLVGLSKDVLGPMYQPILERLNALPDTGNLCHGDFHTGNILINRDSLTVIDWMNAYSGNPLGDVVRTYLMTVSPFISPSTPFYIKWLVLILKSMTAKRYLAEYGKINPFAMDDFNRWFPVIAAARLNDNVPNEREWLLKIIMDNIQGTA
jgi:uncharacterized protein (TIGR02172 family)